MITAQTVSVPKLAVDADKLGFFRFGRVAGGVLVTNEYGEWHHFDDDGFRAFLNGTVAEDSPDFAPLADKGFLRASLDLDGIANAVRRRKRFVGLGPAIHVIPTVGDDGRKLSVEVAKDIVDFAMLSTSGAVELRLVAPGAPDLDLLGFVVQYATEKNRYEGKSLSYTHVGDPAQIDAEAAAWLVDKRFAVRATLAGHAFAAPTVEGIGRLAAAATAKKRDGSPVQVDVTVSAADLAGLDAVVAHLADLGVGRFRLRPVLHGDGAVDDAGWSAAVRAVLAAAIARGGIVEDTLATLTTRAVRTDAANDVEIRSPANGLVAYDVDGGIYPGPGALTADDPSMFQLGVAGETSYKEATTHPTLRTLTLASLLECLPGFAHHWATPYLGVDPLHAWSATGDLFPRAPTSRQVAVQLAALEAVFEVLLGDDAAAADALRSWAR